MNRQANAAPTIIRRKKRKTGGAPHHGGAWKVAYADFVTAMMAFFLMMWLINATTEAQRKGLADYFSPSIPISRVSGGGDGAFGGQNLFADEDFASGTSGIDEARLLEDLEDALQLAGGESLVAEQAMRHVITRLTDRGLIVEIFDLPDASLFDADSDRPMPVLAVLAELLAEVFALAQNGIAIDGHTRTYPVVRVENPVWELSAARAQRMRHILQEAGLAPERMRRVTGHADNAPATDQNHAPRNNRLEIILLRGAD
ncbi:OmpA/MotB family protein [Alkalilacustris brevis]|uniref:OmpA/MotB family protein n=1 Tax=Alkalilacustris brevis TaxID=2026338 RepID=UPI000E0D5810|nr:flagellar motor protein MotB [Alkalilacustris brevis]